MMNAKELGSELAEIVRAHTAPLLARIDELEKQVAQWDEAHEKAQETAKALSLNVVSPENLEKYIADIDGRFAGIMKELAKPPEPPAAPELPDIDAMVKEAVAAAVADIPAPEKGDRGEPGADGKDGRDGRDGMDGAGIKDLLIDRDGGLIATFTDGRTKALGCIVGKDGAPGRDGKDGENGLGFESVFLERDVHGRAVARFVQGDKENSIILPGLVDRGVYKSDETYLYGDCVTWGGSLWIAQAETNMKPGTSEAAWRLAVKKGRDGKDGVVKEVPAPAPVKASKDA